LNGVGSVYTGERERGRVSARIGRRGRRENEFFKGFLEIC